MCARVIFSTLLLMFGFGGGLWALWLSMGGLRDMCYVVMIQYREQVCNPWITVL